MNTRLTRLKKFAGLAVMAIAMAAVGLGLGSGTAQASLKHPNPHPPTITHNQRVDNFFDGIQSRLPCRRGDPI